MIVVTRQDDPDPPFEQCCFCWKATPFWYTPMDVPCCPKCAKEQTHDDVPSKEAWFAVTGLDNSRQTFKSFRTREKEARMVENEEKRRTRHHRSTREDGGKETPGVPLATFAVNRYF